MVEFKTLSWVWGWDRKNLSQGAQFGITRLAQIYSTLWKTWTEGPLLCFVFKIENWHKVHFNQIAFDEIWQQNILKIFKKVPFN